MGIVSPLQEQSIIINFQATSFLSSSPIVRAMVVRVFLAVIATASYNWYYYYDIDLAIFRSCSRAILFPFAWRGACERSIARKLDHISRCTTPSVSSNTMIYQLVLPLRLEGGACERSIARKADHVSRCTTPSVSSSNTMVWQPVDQGEHMSANRAGNTEQTERRV